nr:hypothetical protein [Tanacetum cinerariifolium]
AGFLAGWVAAIDARSSSAIRDITTIARADGLPIAPINSYALVGVGRAGSRASGGGRGGL